MKHKLVSFLTRSENELNTFFVERAKDLEIVCGGLRVNMTEDSVCDVVKDADIIVALQVHP